VHILDSNERTGKEAVSRLGSPAKFHQVDVTSYDSLASVFKAVYTTEKRLDFVFANAGIGERANFYARHDTGIEPPPPPPEMNALVNVCLNGVIMTAWLAQHYFRLWPAGEKSLVITASCGALYPSYYSPIYTATKHAVLGFMRSIAPNFWRADKIRVNAVLPGTVKTNLLSVEEWKNFPEEHFTSVEKIADVVLMLVDGEDPAKGAGRGVLKGKAVECSGQNHYYRDQPEYCDEAMRAVMDSTDKEELE
jgi:NAD(P)-dependent dehydrogenase (short-subunit alcohol dehydrogenase family)